MNILTFKAKATKGHVIRLANPCLFFSFPIMTWDSDRAMGQTIGRSSSGVPTLTGSHCPGYQAEAPLQMPGTEPRTLCMENRCCTTEPHFLLPQYQGQTLAHLTQQCVYASWQQLFMVTGFGGSWFCSLRFPF